MAPSYYTDALYQRVYLPVITLAILRDFGVWRRMKGLGAQTPAGKVEGDGVSWMLQFTESATAGFSQGTDLSGLTVAEPERSQVVSRVSRLFGVTSIDIRKGFLIQEGKTFPYPELLRRVQNCGEKMRILLDMMLEGAVDNNNQVTTINYADTDTIAAAASGTVNVNDVQRVRDNLLYTVCRSDGTTILTTVKLRCTMPRSDQGVGDVTMENIGSATYTPADGDLLIAWQTVAASSQDNYLNGIQRALSTASYPPSGNLVTGSPISNANYISVVLDADAGGTGNDAAFTRGMLSMLIQRLRERNPSQAEDLTTNRITGNSEDALKVEMTRRMWNRILYDEATRVRYMGNPPDSNQGYGVLSRFDNTEVLENRLMDGDKVRGIDYTGWQIWDRDPVPVTINTVPGLPGPWQRFDNSDIAYCQFYMPFFEVCTDRLKTGVIKNIKGLTPADVGLT